MKTKQECADEIKSEIISLLISTKRKGFGKLIPYIESIGYFTSPASTKYHGSYIGGLARHSLRVAELFSEHLEKLKQLNNVPHESIIICSLLHDLCKAGAYIQTKGGFEYNKEHPQGHAKLSIRLIEKHIDLTELERTIIKYHMGYYGSVEFSKYKGEYGLDALAMAQEMKIVKLFHWCDDMESQFEDLHNNPGKKYAVCRSINNSF